MVNQLGLAGDQPEPSPVLSMRTVTMQSTSGYLPQLQQKYVFP